MPAQYLVRAATEFSAAHVLHGYPGACDRIHGHNFRVEVEVVASGLDDIGMAIDFVALQRMTAEITGRLDHRLLNDVPPFVDQNPTAENIARHVFERLRDQLRISVGDRVRLRQVTVAENDRSSVTYSESP